MDFRRKIEGYLVSWKNKKGRKPLIMRGARQVGKTATLTAFAKHFPNFIYINLEKPEHARLFSHEVSLAEFEKIVNLSFGKSLTDNTFLFIDEIQEIPSLLKLLRFFYEEKPRITVAAAGSLFEVRLNEIEQSLPVGRVEYCFMYPLDFLEFLEAFDEKNLADFIHNFHIQDKIPHAIHERLLSLFYDYTLIGGMPEAVKIYLETKDIKAVNEVYSNLFLSFRDDIYKYSNLTKAKYVTFVLEQAPLFAGTTITYENFASSAFKSREIAHSFDILQKAMLVYQVRGTKSSEFPLMAKRKKPPKVLFLDIGFVNYLMGVQSQYLSITDLTGLYRGRIAEQIVGQTLLSTYQHSLPNLYYWYAKSGSQAEIDFCLPYNGNIIGFEVKSGTAGKLRSAHSFLKRVKNGIIIRAYTGEFKRQEKLTSLPFYLLPVWQKIIEEILSEKN